MSDISRRGFLQTAAVAGCGALVLGGCQSGGSVAGSVTPVNNMAQLTFAMFPKLATIGDGVVVDIGGNPIAVIRTGDTTASALSAVCTHERCTVEIQSGSPPLYCACHGSEFAISGVVVRGPARTSLRTYTATVDSVGVTVALA
ncbi:MAG: Iron-sulfur cluster-binding protein, Rieske family [bacterium]|nr:Iron-sulfur cluster-binding protein, Rieske family [bacterium]